MEVYVISKVISLKMKTLIFAVICTYLNLNLGHHKEEHVLRQRLYESGNYSSCPNDGKYSNVIFIRNL